MGQSKNLRQEGKKSRKRICTRKESCDKIQYKPSCDIPTTTSQTCSLEKPMDSEPHAIRQYIEH
jgi:hypothetical protein